MKTINLMKATLIILTGLMMTLSLTAGNEKYSRRINNNHYELTIPLRLQAEDAVALTDLIGHSEELLGRLIESGIHVRIEGPAAADYHVRFSLMTNEPIEDWMLESEYLNEESVSAIESWMMQEDYLETDHQELEGWMFDSGRLTDAETASAPEPWMFDANYLSK